MGASLFRVGSVWHYRFQIARKRTQCSTRETRRWRAEEIANKAYEDEVVRVNGGKPVPTLRELIDAWLAANRPVVSVHHAASVERFGRLHLYGLGDKRITEITTGAVELARNAHLLERKPASANHWLRILKLLTLWAVKRGIILAAPWKVAMIKVQKRPRAVLPLDVARAWFDAVDAACVRSPGVAVAVRLMFGLGLREGESASARWEWVDWQRGTYTPGITKGREAEPVPLPDWLRDFLKPLRQAEGLIACRPDGQPFAPGFARHALRRANAACAVKGITPHRLRGTFATLLSEAGVPIQTIQKVMRHKSFTTTMGYLEKNLDTAARAQNRIGGEIGFNWRKSGEPNRSAPAIAGGAND
jgi:integrase